MKSDDFQARVLGNEYLARPFKIAVILFANWVFHGFLYMDRTEKAFYVLLDGVFILPVFLALSATMTLGSRVLLALVIAHTLHWLFNGHLYALLKKLGLSKTELNRFAEYAERLRERAQKERSVFAIASFGSLSRGQLTESSDLDVRIIRRPGVINGTRACVFTFLERSRAILNRFPLDVYTFDGFHSLSKMSPDESPIVLYDPEMELQEYRQGK